MSDGNDLLGNLVSYYALPSVIALLTKVGVLWFCRSNISGINPWLSALIVSLIGLNLSELLLFVFTERATEALLTLQIYYICAVCAPVSMLGLAASIHDIKFKIIDRAMMVCILAGLAVIAIPEAALTGAVSIGYSVARVAGPAYFVLQIIILTTLIAAMTITIHASFKLEDSLKRKRALALLMGFTPGALVVITTIVAMHLGAEFNATVTLSICTTIFMAVLIYTDSEQGLFNFLSRIPRTEERSYIEGIRRVCHNDVSLVAAKEIMQEVATMQSLAGSTGDRKKVARKLQQSIVLLQHKLRCIESGERGDS
jgi:hypothetical protein